MGCCNTVKQKSYIVDLRLSLDRNGDSPAVVESWNIACTIYKYLGYWISEFLDLNESISFVVDSSCKAVGVLAGDMGWLLVQFRHQLAETLHCRYSSGLDFYVVLWPC